MHMPARCRPTVVGSTILALVVGLGLSGCATTSTTKYAVTIDAVANPAARNGWSYTLAGTNPSRTGTVPIADISSRVHTALSQRGLFEAPNPAEADYVITFDYGQRAEQAKVETVTQPVMVQPDPLATGSAISGPTVGTGYPGSGYPGTGPYRSNAPQVVMVQTTQVTRTSEKYFVIVAQENVPANTRGARPPMEAWRVEATIEDESADVQAAVPALIDAVIEYIGTSTAEPQRVVVELRS